MPYGKEYLLSVFYGHLLTHADAFKKIQDFLVTLFPNGTKWY